MTDECASHRSQTRGHSRSGNDGCAHGPSYLQGSRDRVAYGPPQRWARPLRGSSSPRTAPSSTPVTERPCRVSLRQSWDIPPALVAGEGGR